MVSNRSAVAHLSLEENLHKLSRIEEEQESLVDTKVESFNEVNYNESWRENTNVMATHLENWWSVFDVQYVRHSAAWTITLLIAYTSILIVGVIGNFMVVLVVVLRPKMRTVTNMFILNLAVADLSVVVFCVPATLMANVFTPWILGSFMCKAVAYIQGVSVCASAYSSAAISFERCKAIYRPLKSRKGLSKRQAFLIIGLVWITALLVTLPWPVVFSVVTSASDGLTYCLETWENKFHGKMYFLVANLIGCYCLPFVLIFVSNIVICCHVSNRKIPNDLASVGMIKQMHRRTRHGVRRMLGVVTLTFLFSWLPLYALVTKLKFSTHLGDTEADIILDVLMPCAQWLGSWNSCINPVLYAFLNSRFREMFKSLVPRWIHFQCNKHSSKQQNATDDGTFKKATILIGEITKRFGYATVLTACSPVGIGENKHLVLREQYQHRRFFQQISIWNRLKLRETDSYTATSTMV